MSFKSQLYMIPLGEKMSVSVHNRLLPYIPKEKRDQLKRFYHWEDAQRTLLGYSAASYLLATELGLAREEIKYNVDYYGKPTLPNQEAFFNISHSGEWIACGISESVIGVDVEQIKEIDLAIAEHFFASIEVTDLMNLPPTEQDDYFFTLWTLKESYIKAEGTGISIPLDSFWFRVINQQITFFAESTRNWQYRLYDFDPGYKLACCVEGGDLPERVKILTWEDLY